MNRYVKFVIFSSVLLLLFVTRPAFAYDNTKYNWSYKPAPQHTRAKTEEIYERLLEKAGGYYIGNPNKKVLYLTFDNGYENGYTESILDTLKEKEVPGAFFVTGHYLKSAADLVKRMVAEGHIVGNHSFHHPSLPAINDRRLEAELEDVKQLFTELTEEPEMRYLRPPRGEFSERTLMKTKELGYTNVFWSLAYKDWDPNQQKGGDYAYRQIMKRIHPGAIMLVHAVSADNAEALPRIIDECQKLGYTFRSLDDLAFEQVLP